MGQISSDQLEQSGDIWVCKGRYSLAKNFVNTKRQGQSRGTDEIKSKTVNKSLLTDQKGFTMAQ